MTSLPSLDDLSLDRCTHSSPPAHYACRSVRQSLEHFSQYWQSSARPLRRSTLLPAALARKKARKNGTKKKRSSPRIRRKTWAERSVGRQTILRISSSQWAFCRSSLCTSSQATQERATVFPFAVTSQIGRGTWAFTAISAEIPVTPSAREARWRLTLRLG
jgi:hypothetical protein